MTNTTTDRKITRAASIRSIKMRDLRISPRSQREVNENRVKKIRDTIDLDRLGTLTVSHRDGLYWIIDGQHRFHALREHLQREFGDDWADWEIQTWCYFGLTEQQEAERFLQFNDTLAVNAYDRFRVGVAAGLPVPTDIDRIVRSLGLKVARTKDPGHIGAVASLEHAYRTGIPILVTMVSTIRDAWDGIGYDSPMMDGLTMFIARYDGQFDRDRLVKRLGAIRNGARGVRQSAGTEREATGCSWAEAHAAALVKIYNKQLRGRSVLTNWWRYELDQDLAAA